MAATVVVVVIVVVAVVVVSRLGLLSLGIMRLCCWRDIQWGTDPSMCQNSIFAYLFLIHLNVFIFMATG